MRRWLMIAVALLLLAGGGAYAAYKTWIEEPGDVFNPDVEFSEDGAEEQRPKRRGKRFVWPIYGFDLQRTRYLDAKIRPPFKPPLWKFGGGQLLEFPPVLANGTLYFVRNSGDAYALRASDGRLRWKRRVGRLNASSPAYANGRLYVVTLSGRVTALRARDGKLVWRRDLPSRSESSPVFVDGRIYFGSEDGTVYALRAKDGRVRWTYRARGAVKGGLAYHRGVLYFGDYAGQVTAVRAKDGSRVWRKSTSGRSFGRAGRFYSTPAVKFGRVFLGNTDGKVYSFGIRSGALAWTRSTGGYVYASPAVARVRGTKPTVYIGSYDGTFYALDARNGETIWTHDAGGRISGAATVIGRTVYFSDLGNKETSGLRVENGKRVFHIKRGAFNPVIADERRIYLTGYSSLYAFEPRKRGRR